MLRSRQLCLLFASLLLALAAQAAEITVSAASSLSEAFREIGRSYEQRHPGNKILFNFAASDTLLQQIAKGAPVDVFASADAEAMNKAVQQNLIVESSRQTFAGNRLVLIQPRDAALKLKSLAELASKPQQRIAIGNPETVPAGRYAKAALEEAQFWQPLRARLIMAQNVRQALDYVARGEVEAGFVYASDAFMQPDKVSVAFAVPTPSAVRYPIAVVEGSRNLPLAQSFNAWVKRAEAQAILANYGFTPP